MLGGRCGVGEGLGSNGRRRRVEAGMGVWGEAGRVEYGKCGWDGGWSIWGGVFLVGRVVMGFCRHGGGFVLCFCGGLQVGFVSETGVMVTGGGVGERGGGLVCGGGWCGCFVLVFSCRPVGVC